MRCLLAFSAIAAFTGLYLFGAPAPAPADEGRLLMGHKGWVGAATFAPDSKTLATASADRAVRLWDVASGMTKRVQRGHADVVSCVAFSPDGAMLASGSFDGAVKLWDTLSGEHRLSLPVQRGVIQTLAFSPDGKTLATGGLEGVVQLWNPRTGQLQASLRGHRSWVNAVVYSRNGGLLVSGSSDGTVRGWDTTTKGERFRFDVSKVGEVRSLALSADGETLAVGLRYGIVKLWDVPRRRELATLRGHVSDVWGVAFTPDGKTLASGDGDWNQPGEVKLWDVASGKKRATVRTTGEVLCLAISADGRFLAAGSWNRTVKLVELARLSPTSR